MHTFWLIQCSFSWFYSGFQSCRNHRALSIPRKNYPEYWKYVEYGTYKMASNPYIERAESDLSSKNLVYEVVDGILREMGINE